MQPSVAISLRPMRFRRMQHGLLLLVLPCLLLPLAARAQVSFDGFRTSLGGGLLGPRGVVLDAHGNVFVADTSNNAVKEILAQGGYVTISTLGSGFDKPCGVAVDGIGDVFVADEGNNAVKEMLAVKGTIPASPVIKILGSGFSGPHGVTVGALGNVFVADTGNNAVKEIVAAGGYKSVIPLGSGFKSPYGVALDATGDVFVADTGNHAVKEILLAGGYVTVDTLAAANGKFSSPEGIALDGGGNVYVADTGNDAVKEIVAAGGYSTATEVGVGFGAPEGLALDMQGNLIVAEGSSSKLVKLALGGVNFGLQAVGSPSATVSLPFTIASTADTAVSRIAVLTTGIAGKDFANAAGSTCTAKAYTAATNCQVNVSFQPLDPGLRRGAVEFYGAKGNLLATVPVYGNGSGPQTTFLPGVRTVLGNHFKDVYGVAVDGKGNVFVADGWSGTVKEMVAAGGSIPATPVIKTVGGSYGYPGAVAVDRSGNLFVTDSGNNAVYEILAVDGAIPASPTVNALGSGFGDPGGVAVDGSGNVYVADYFSKSILEMLAVDGSIPTTNPTIKALGSGLSGPDGVAVDGSGNVFVADAGYGAVYEILAKGGYVTVKGLGGSFDFGTVLSAAVDGTGNVFVGDDFGRVDEIPAAGGYSTVKVLGSGFSAPTGVAVDGSGNVFVADYGFNAVFEIAADCKCVKTLSFGLQFPDSVAVDADENVFVGCDNGYSLASEMPAAGGYATIKPLGVAFKHPTGVALDGSGNVFVADNEWQLLEVMAAGGYTAEFARGIPLADSVAVDGGGNVFVTSSDAYLQEALAVSGYTTVNAIGSGLSLDGTGVALDANGNLFLASGAYPGRGVEEVLAADGYATVKNLGGSISQAWGVAVDGGGDLFVANEGSLLELPAAEGYATVRTLASGFDGSKGVAVDGNGNIYVTDESNNQVVKLDFADPPALAFAATAGGSTSADSPRTVTVQNSGNAPLRFSKLTYPADFRDDGSSCTASTELAAGGGSCTLIIAFSPVAIGGTSTSVALNESVTLTTNTLNQAAAQQQIAVSGTETKLAPTLTLKASTTSPVVGAEFTLTATASGTGAVPAGTVTFYLGGVATGSPVELKSGVATLKITLNAKSTVTAVYSGDAVYAERKSNAVVVTPVQAVAAAVLDAVHTVDALLGVRLVKLPEGEF